MGIFQRISKTLTLPVLAAIASRTAGCNETMRRRGLPRPGGHHADSARAGVGG